VRFSAADGSLSVEEVVRNAGDEIRECDVYLCGPLGMIRAFEDGLRRAGVPAHHLHFEEFSFR
jgi:predicted ferric reductase